VNKANPQNTSQASVGISILKLLPWAYVFFLSIAFMGAGMKASFKAPLKAYLHDHAADFTELVSFVIGVIGTSLVQSSSTVTSMAVVLTQEEIVPLIIAIGIVHGANLGTSVTSSLVAFAAETRQFTGNIFKDAWALLFARRNPGFRRAVGTAVVHGLFNAVLVTGILLAFELPFGLIHNLSEWTAGSIGGALAGGGNMMEVLTWVSPGTYTKPVAKAMMHAGAPGWVMVVLGFVALFVALKGFSATMRTALNLDNDDPTDDIDVEAIGVKLLGSHPLDTFMRGLILTILVQSSSATTSMVVPLAAMGFFSLRQIFPFILGANIGTTTTALLAASTAVGQPGFEAGLTIALSHFYLNSFAVLLVVVVPGLQDSVLACTEWLSDAAVKVPAVLLGYLVAMSVALPVLVFFSPDIVSRVVLGSIVAVMLIAPHVYSRRKAGELTTLGELGATDDSTDVRAA